MKKQLIMALLLVSALTLTGCYPHGVEFAQLINEINSVEESQETGEISVKVELKDESMQDPQVNQIIELINSSKISYTGVKGKNNQYSVGIDLVTGGETLNITHIVMDSEAAFIRVDTLESLESYFTTGVYTKSTEPVYIKSTGEIGVESVDNLEVFFESIIEVYQDFKYEGLLVKEGNKFIMSVESDDIGNLLHEFEKYTLDNKEEILHNFDNMVDKFSDEDLNTYFPGETRESVKLEVRESLEEYEISEFTEIEDMPDMEFMMSLEKIEGESYLTEYKMLIDTDEVSVEISAVSESRVLAETTDEMFKIESTATVIEQIPDVEIIEPIPGQQNKMIIDTVTNEYFVDIANDALPGRVEQVNIITQEGRLYLPLRQVGESLGEDVQWDAQSMTPYINQNGVRIDMGGLLVDSKAYVKIRDFEKVGYTVDWDDVTKEASLIK